MEGKIGNYPASMELSIGEWYEPDDKFYSGFYYYHSQELPIEIYQTDTIFTENLTLTSWNDENAQELFQGKLINGIYKGTWTKGNQKLSFEFKQVSEPTEIIRLQNSIKVPIETDKTNEPIAGTYEYDWYLPKDLKLQRELVGKIDSVYDYFDSYTKRNLENFEKEYRSEISDFLNDVDEVYPSMMNYTFIEGFTPVINSKNYLVMRYSAYQYTGGAHGMSHERYFTYAKKNQKWLEIDDILDRRYEIQINMVLDKTVRKEHNIPSGVKLNEAENTIFLADSIYYSPNFTLSKKGITFHYGLYEMTPYVYGFFSVFVPYDDLKLYLKKEFKY